MAQHTFINCFTIFNKKIMHYIKQLQLQIDSMNTTILEIQKIENDIRIYLNSDKFLGFENKFVNPDDILRMLSPMRDIILQSEMVEQQ